MLFLPSELTLTLTVTLTLTLTLTLTSLAPQPAGALAQAKARMLSLPSELTALRTSAARAKLPVTAKRSEPKVSQQTTCSYR